VKREEAKREEALVVSLKSKGFPTRKTLGLNKVRAAELEKVPLDPDARSSSDGGLCCCFSRRRPAERTPLMTESNTV
jgi:hypothetical protein